MSGIEESARQRAVNERWDGQGASLAHNVGPPRRPLTAAPPDSLADVLERVLDKGIVIAGDITISLAQIELLQIKVRLLIASIDKAQEMGINWWQSDPALNTRTGQLEEENRQLRERLDRLEHHLAPPPSPQPTQETQQPPFPSPPTPPRPKRKRSQ